MVLIRISEWSEGGGAGNAKLSFGQEEEYPITISDPFSEEQEQELEWYFERHLSSPFTDQIRARDAASRIGVYGETLFKQVFSNPDAYTHYKSCSGTEAEVAQIEIIGSPAFHRWHWEALKDPDQPQALALHTTIVRKHTNTSAVHIDVRPSSTINLLLVTARPRGKGDVGYRTISRPLVESLRQAHLPIKIDILRPGTYRALVTHLGETAARHGIGYYHVIHFDVHGALYTYDIFKLLRKLHSIGQEHSGHNELAPYEGRKAFLLLEGEPAGTADLLEASELADLLFAHQVPIAILNACQSGKQTGASETSLGSRLIQSGVQLVLAMGYSITVSAATILMSTLYRELFAGNDLSAAILQARRELAKSKARHAYFNQIIDLEDWLLPVIYQNRQLHLNPRPFTAEEATNYYGRQATRYLPLQPSYGFVGRDLDILQIEKCLLTKRNLLLVRGMGGAGKTALLKHLGGWWQTTGFVDQVFYFGYDERAWTHQQLLVGIAQQLLDPAQYTRDFQPLSLHAQQALLTRRLRSERHLLILDNLESITGEHLAIQHILSPDEQARLRHFLGDLVGGRTLIMLGSRSDVAWLAKETFEKNVYDLSGLDPEAASILSDLILERHGKTQYRQDGSLHQLLKLLAGFPLAMEVVLANLVHKSPNEVLEALQAGEVSLDKGDSQDKTESILRCIDYAHSNLSRNAQELLLCLAPFTAVLYLGGLDLYTTYLKQQPALVTLPFERWREVLEEAQNWGLLSPYPDFPGFLVLQPVLPFFLRARLQAPEQANIRGGIETAFRLLYDKLSHELWTLLTSHDPQERQRGQSLVSLEYENIVAALDLALTAQASIFHPYDALSHYLEVTQNQQQGLDLGRSVSLRLEAYPPEQLVGQAGLELSMVIDLTAKQQLALKRYEEAEASYQKALSLLLRNTQYSAEFIQQASCHTYHQLGTIAEEQRQWDKAKQYYQQALQIEIQFDDRKTQTRTYHQLGAMSQHQYQWTQAEQYYQQALHILEELGDRHFQASTYHQLGIVALEQRQWAQAEHYYRQALHIYHDFSDLYEQAGTYHELGFVAQLQHQWEQAKGYYQQALQIEIQFGDRYNQAKTYTALGMLAQEQQQWAQAEQYYQLALQILDEFGDRYTQAKTFHSLGTLAEEQHQWTRAEQYYQQALQIFGEVDDDYTQAATYNQLGVMAQEQGQWEKAYDLYLQALKTFVRYKDSHNEGTVLQNLAQLWQSSDGIDVPRAVALVIDTTPEEAKEMLRKMVE